MTARRWRRFLPAFGVAAVAAGALVFMKNRPVQAAVARVDVGPVVREAAGTGTIESEAQVGAAFTIAGRVTEVRVHEGDLVHPGVVLATLDPGEQDRQMSLARRNVDLAASAIERSEAEITRARVVLEAALADQRRVDELFVSGAVSPAERDAAHERAARAKSELAAAIAAKKQGTDGVAVARENVRLQARRAEDAVIRSTFEGVVVKRLHEPGDVVNPGSVVLVVASTQKVWARTWMDETVLHELREGQPARVVLRGDTEHPLRARVDRLAVEADRKTHELLVDLELLERPGRLVFGQRADGFVTLEERPSAPRVPQGACDLEARRCFVSRDEHVAAADVTFGLAGSEWVEVVAGVQRGDEVLIPTPGSGGLPIGRRVARRSP